MEDEVIKFSDVTKIIIRDNWDLTEEEKQLSKDENLFGFNLSHHEKFEWYDEMKNFYLVVIRMKEIDEIESVIEYYISKKGCFMFDSIYRLSFVKFAAYAIPSSKAINQIVTWFHERNKIVPETKLVDFGAGSGLWSLLLNHAGIPKESLIAVDLPEENKHIHKFTRKYYDIIESKNYKVDSNDIFCILWGYIDKNIIDDYIKRGGKCIIILGEESNGCTNPPGDLFIHDNRWDVTSVGVVPGAYTWIEDILSLNVLK